MSNLELPEGDAVAIMRKCGGIGALRKLFDIECVSGWQTRCLAKLADMVERDYVYREVFDVMCDECQRLEAERDEWKAKAEQAMESYADAKDARDTWMSNYLQAERAMNKAAGKWARTDAELRANDTEVISDNLGKSQDSEIENCGQDADQPKREESPDYESDSREKLEADVHAIAKNTYWESMVIEWLDRQASITSRDWCWTNDSLQEQVDYLKEQLETVNDAYERQDRKYVEGKQRIAELQEKVDALTQANADYREEWHRVCRERDDLQRKLHESNRERERLRKSLGIAIDHAHDMIALVSVDTDKGTA